MNGVQTSPDEMETPAAGPHAVLFDRPGREAPPVSVAVSLYNYGRFITDCLDSVEAQTMPGLDLVVVDDASADGSEGVALRWLQGHADRFAGVRLVRHRRNLGLAAARNTAFAEARTEYVFVLDADNLLYPRCVGQLAAALDGCDADFAYCYLEKFGAETGLVSAAPQWDPGRFQHGNRIDAMALLRRRVWQEVGGYSPGPVTGWEDFELWFKIARRPGWGVLVPEVLARYRVHPNSMLRTLTLPREPELWQYLRGKYPEFFTPDGRPPCAAGLVSEREEARAELARVRGEHASLAAELARSREAERRLRQELADVHGSRSWKVTAPVRSLTRRVRHLCGRRRKEGTGAGPGPEEKAPPSGPDPAAPGAKWDWSLRTREEAAADRELVDCRFLYRRVGYDERPLRLLAGGRIGEGAAGLESHWGVRLCDGAPVLVIGGEEAPTMFLRRQPDGVWQGRWDKYERMPVELVPEVTGAVQDTGSRPAGRDRQAAAGGTLGQGVGRRAERGEGHLVIVLGMHRSGTSCLTLMLHRCGMYLGTRLMSGTAVANLEGHWENEDVVALNDHILELSGGGWDRVPPALRVDEETTARMRSFLAGLSGHPVAGWKDPRTVVTFPTWKPLLSRYRIVACLRHPLAVARSLQGREGWPLEQGLRLWADYNARLLLHVRGEPGVRWFNFDLPEPELMEGVRGLCRELGLAPAETVAQLFNPFLRHHAEAEMPRDPRLRALYEELLEAARASAPGPGSGPPTVAGHASDDRLLQLARVSGLHDAVQQQLMRRQSELERVGEQRHREVVAELARLRQELRSRRGECLPLTGRRSIPLDG